MKPRIAPAGNFPARESLSKALRAAKQIDPSPDGTPQSALLRSIADCFDGREVVLTSSATEALFLVFSELKRLEGRNRIFLSAYNCPELVTAAVNAGLAVHLLDTHEKTLEPDLRPLQQERDLSDAVLVLTNLYGIPNSGALPESLLHSQNLRIVDDGAQLFGGRRGENIQLLDRSLHFSVLSFGRGKGICGVGGGAIGFPRNISAEQSRLDQKAGPARSEFKDRVRYALARLFEHPSRYAFPSSMPFLNIGDTVFHPELQRGQLSQFQALVALARFQEEAAAASTFVRNARLWHEIMRTVGRGVLEQPFANREFGFGGDVVPIRYPLILSRALDDQTVSAIRAGLFASRLGMSGSYPGTLADLCPGAVTVRGSLEGASSIANRVVTLPVHAYVSEDT
ncbi:MAG: DegT/DnrJ/EryC1/StrS family aminotransferase, partial [Deltaproteobacteria bacterium]|nr:DegT/DnrJ/EryC1/StrS family aminotransferase [Deltaproteobacteria bacterium]